MRPSRVEKLLPALTEIGAILVFQGEQTRSNEQTRVAYFQWKGRFVEVSSNISDGISIALSQPAERLDQASDWKPMFAFTVPAFDDFNDEQKLDWILQVPSGDAYVDFLIEHIRRLGSVAL